MRHELGIGLTLLIASMVSMFTLAADRRKHAPGVERILDALAHLTLVVFLAGLFFLAISQAWRGGSQ